MRVLVPLLPSDTLRPLLHIAIVILPSTTDLYPANRASNVNVISYAICEQLAGNPQKCLETLEGRWDQIIADVPNPVERSELILYRLHVSERQGDLKKMLELLDESEDKIKDKLSDEDKETLEEVVKTTTEWIDENASADKDEFDEKQKEVEKTVNPIMSKLYAAGGAGGGDGGGDDEEMPDHDEL